MHVAEFSCPSCATPLRVRDRGFVGRTIDCPDCGERVRIVQSDAGRIKGIVAEEPVAQRRHRGPANWRNPTAVGWIVAGCLAAGLGLYLLRDPSLSQDEQTSAEDAAAVAADRVPSEDVGQPAPDLRAPLESPAQQLVAIGGTIDGTVAAANLFPAGTVAHANLAPSQRLSWIAALIAARDPGGPLPAWDRPWNDPANARFVRRKQPDWLNPLVDSVVSSDRYPATHFVGVAGVGDDAAALPADHPRAGIFGHDRRVSFDDVGDGLANTMLVAGVENRLGSWAAGGDASVRGFTAEPYIGGPDGFGTGEADHMHVLMADGSVRTVSRETDPTLIRRMAAMNDGLPLDPSVPGEPGRESPTDAGQPHQFPLAIQPEEPAEQPREAAGADERAPDAAAIIADLARGAREPIDVLLAEPPATYETEAALRQRIVAFEQPDPVPVRDLLNLLEEMLAVPIHTRELPPESVLRLDEAITLSRGESTLEEILRAILKQVDLSFDARPEGIFVHAGTGSQVPTRVEASPH
jgi:hypothetical protein